MGRFISEIISNVCGRIILAVFLAVIGFMVLRPFFTDVVESINAQRVEAYQEWEEFGFENPYSSEK